jgi:hypothetical protein
MADEKTNFVELNSILNQIDWDDVSATTGSGSYDDLPKGYYLCEVEKAQLKKNKSETNMQVSFQFKVVEDGLSDELDSKGFSVWKTIDHTKGRKVFKHYALKDTDSVKRFVSDMLKFEGEKPGEPVLEKDYFMEEGTIQDALDILVGMRIYVNASYKEYQGKTNCWYDIIGWDRARTMKLPV